jgi:fibronectin-binding autotransporter adhesin
MKTPQTSRLARISKAGVLLLALLAAKTATQAADITWIGGADSYTNPAAWTGGVVPATADNAINDNGTNNFITINPGVPDWSLTAILAGSSAGDGAVVQNGQNVNLVGATRSVRLGVNAGFTGVYTMNGGALNFTNSGFDVGELGTGILNVTGGTISGTSNLTVNFGVLLTTPNPVTATMDGGIGQGGYTWFEQGLFVANTALGLPAAGTTFTSASQGDHSYTLPSSYAANDAVLITSNVTSATITLSASAPYSALSFLASAGNGPITVNYTVNHADSSFETGSLVVPDWFATNAPALGSGGRVNKDASTYQNSSAGGNPKIFGLDVALTNTTSAVTTINLFYTTGNGAACIFALSGSTGTTFDPLAITGFNEDMVVEAAAQTFVANTVTSVVNQSGGFINLTGPAQFLVGNYGNGVYNFSGGTNSVNNFIAIGRSGGNGLVNMTGGEWDQTGSGNNFLVGTGFQAPTGSSGAVGVLNQNGGLISCQGQFLCPENSPSTGTYNLTNGTLVVNNWIAVGRNGGAGVFNVAGGSITKTGGTGNHLDIGAGGLGVINQTGGAITNITSETWIGENAGGTWNLEGGLANLSTVHIGQLASSSGTLNADGGTLVAGEITTGNALAVSILNLNGTVIQASAASVNFLHDIFLCQVKSGGAIFDSQGFNLTIPQSLPNNGGDGSGGLTKLSAGTLTLSGVNTYSGPTVVSGGKLLTSTDSSGNGDFSIANGAGFGVTSHALNGQYTVVNGSFASTATTLDIDLGAFGNPTSAPLNIAGTLAVNGTVTVNVADSIPAAGQIPLVKYSAKTGSGSFVLGTLPSGSVGFLSNNVANASIDLVITSAGAPRWDGTVTGGVWDINTTANWFDLGTSLTSTYHDGTPVLFNDAATGTTNVNLVTTVNPASITITNAALTYTIAGAGKISGATGLTKLGTGAASILISGGNNFTGPVTISGGSLLVTNLANGGSPSAIGASSANPTNLVIGNATFSYAGAPVVINRGYKMTANSVLDTRSNLTLSGTALASAGTLFKTGAGTMTYAGANTNVLSPANVGGAYQVQNGTVVFDGSAGGQSNSVIGEMWVASVTTSTANLVVTNSALATSSWLALGRGNGNSGFLSTASIYNSVLNVSYGNTGASGAGNGGGVSLGYNNGLPNLATQVFTLAGNSVLTNAGGNFNIGESTGSSATLTVTNTSIITSIYARNLIGGSASKGVLNLNSTGTSTMSTSSGQFFLGGFGGTTDPGVGALNLTTGTLKFGNGSGVYVHLGDNGGTAPTAYGSFNMSGGVLSETSGDGFRVGYGGYGSFVQSGGTVYCGRYVSIGGNTVGGNGVATFTGGTFGIFNTTYRFLVPDAAGTAVVNIGTLAGGTAIVTNISASGFILENTAGGKGTLNLNSGTLQLGGTILRNATGAGGSAVVNLNGATLQAGVNNLTIINNTLDSVNVYNGGLTVDSMGNASTVSANLLPTAGSGLYPAGGTLTVPGGGGSGYIGAPLVAISGGSGTGATAIATVSGGVVTNVIITCPGQNYVAGNTLNFAFNGGGFATAATTFSYTLQPGDILANGTGGLTKIGSGSVTYSGVGTFTGNTAVSNGTLFVNGTLTGPAQVSGGSTLGGTGIIKGAVTVGSGATLAPGISAIGTLSISNALTFAAGSTNAAEVNKTTLTQDLVKGITTLTYGGTLTVTNLAATAFANGDSFKLFDATTYTGAFSAIIPASPGSGLVWNTNQLTTSGTLSVVSGVNTNPTNIVTSVSGGNLNLSWPSDHTGWRLQIETNALNSGLGTNWVTVPNSSATNAVSVPLNPANPAVFLRLVYP